MANAASLSAPPARPATASAPSVHGQPTTQARIVSNARSLRTLNAAAQRTPSSIGRPPASATAPLAAAPCDCAQSV